MRRRRRYEVVVEGVSGHAAAQRSVISEHRSEDAAREDARMERARLEVLYGEGAGAWRVVVTHDDRVIAEERPAGSAGPRAAPTSLPAPSFEPAPADEPGAGAEPEPEAPPEPDRSGPVPDWLIEQVEQSIARSAERDRERDGGD